MLDFSFKAEVIQEKACAQGLAVVHVHDVGGFLDVFQDGKAQIFEDRVLLVVAEKCILALYNFA